MAKKITLETLATQMRKELASLDVRMAKGFAAVAEDTAELRIELKSDIGRLSGQLASIESELRDIKRRLAVLETSVADMKGFAKEIDALNERVRAIEKHLGLNKKIAA